MAWLGCKQNDACWYGTACLTGRDEIFILTSLSEKGGEAENHTQFLISSAFYLSWVENGKCLPHWWWFVLSSSIPKPWPVASPSQVMWWLGFISGTSTVTLRLDDWMGKTLLEEMVGEESTRLRLERRQLNKLKKGYLQEMNWTSTTCIQALLSLLCYTKTVGPTLGVPLCMQVSYTKNEHTTITTCRCMKPLEGEWGKDIDISLNNFLSC